MFYYWRRREVQPHQAWQYQDKRTRKSQKRSFRPQTSLMKAPTTGPATKPDVSTAVNRPNRSPARLVSAWLGARRHGSGTFIKGAKAPIPSPVELIIDAQGLAPMPRG